MRHLLLLPCIVLLTACGMKGDLYEPPPPAEPAAEPAEAGPSDTDTAEADKGERKTIPPTPDPALSR